VSGWAIELNDAGVALVGPHGLHALEPGYAFIEGEQVLLGHEARAHCRLRPRQTFTDFWRELSPEPLADPAAGGRSSAELAAMQLGVLWQRARQLDPLADRVLFALPGQFDRARLAALLGAAQAARLPVCGLVDAAVAASAHTPPGWQLLHAELGLHELRLTQLGQHDGLRRSRFELLPEVGLLRLRERWTQAIAERFIAETRYDPLHDGASEQLLHDQLDGWLGQLGTADAIAVSLPAQGEARALELGRRELLAATRTEYRALVRWIAGFRAPGAPALLQLGPRLGELPGICEALERLADTVVRRLPEGSAAQGARAKESLIRSAGNPQTLVLRLPLQGPPLELERPPRSAQDHSGPPATHLVYRGLAYPIGEAGFSIGLESAPAGAGLQLAPPEPLAGVSRRHCSLFVRGGELVLQDQSRYGTFVNELRAAAATALRAGDVIRVGTPGVELQVIGLARRDAA
jgi:hypothetical protein